MNTRLIARVHRAAALLAPLCITVFLLSTMAVELFGTHAQVAQVKAWIVMPGLLLLIPAIAAAGGTGFALSRKRAGRLVQAKKRRMPIIALNGLLVLLPCALLLAHWSAAGRFDAVFYSVQTLEWGAGLANLVLIGLNMRDGRTLAGCSGSKNVHARSNGSMS